MSNYFGKLKRFPLGAIHAQGFLKDQMLRGKDGIAGHLYELEPGMILDPYINKTQVNSWSGHDQLGWGAEISGNYWSGYIQYAFTLNDREMMDIATDWVNTSERMMIPMPMYTRTTTHGEQTVSCEGSSHFMRLRGERTSLMPYTNVCFGTREFGRETTRPLMPVP